MAVENMFDLKIAKETYKPSAAFLRAVSRCVSECPCCARSWSDALPPAKLIHLSSDTKSSAAENTVTKCLRGHDLLAVDAKHAGFACDICRQPQPVGACLYGCRLCDYDVCETCRHPGAQVDGVGRMLQDLTLLARTTWPHPIQADSASGSDDEETDDTPEYCKMVILVRADLKMTPGKIAAQCCHGCLACFRLVSSRNSRNAGAQAGFHKNDASVSGFQQITSEPLWSSWLQAWEAAGEPKITLKVQDEQTLKTKYIAAMGANLPAVMIEDEGRTQIAPGSRTVCAIGPAPGSLIDAITGRLSLF
jgi:PTH2 family peptidyl-tRNA hydrolase